MRGTLVCIAALVLGLAADEGRAAPKSGAAPPKTSWAAQARAVAWSLDPEATVLDYVRAVRGYDVALIHDGKTGGFHDLRIEIRKAGKLVFGWTGHEETPLLVDGDVLVFSDHSAIASGAAIVAVDLTTGTQRWRTPLDGIGPVHHSQYRNQVRLERVGQVVVVQGLEASGRYVALVDAATGAALANDVRKGR